MKKNKPSESELIKWFNENRGVREVSNITGFHFATIARWWRELGLISNNKLLKCEVCKKKFKSLTKWQKYCSEKCRIKKYQLSDKGKLAKKKADFIYRNSPKGKKKMKEYQKSERGREVRKKYKKSEKARINRRKYDHERIPILKLNAQYMIKKRLRNLLYNALRKYTETGKIASSSKYGLDYKSVIEHLIKNKPLAVDIKDLLNGREWHIDHVIPLSYFDLTNPKQIQVAFSPKNLQWLKGIDNMIKQDTLPDGSKARNKGGVQNPYFLSKRAGILRKVSLYY